MKKRTLLFGAALMLTSLFFTTSCKDAVEDAVTGGCYTCTDGTSEATTCENACLDGFTCKADYEADGYTCTKN